MPYSTYTDEDLFILLKEGDHNAFCEIYNRYSGVLYAHTVRRLQNTEEAMDIVHELFTYLWQKKKDIEIASYLSAYLYTSVRNRIINVIAHRDVTSKYYVLKQESFQVTTASTDHLVREKQLVEIIENEVRVLPKRMREVFELSRFKHMSHKEIAIKLNITELTVKKQINKALRILRVKLDLFTVILLACLFFL